MKSILTTIAFLALAVSGLAQTRSVIVNTSGVVQSPTNFWSADVTNARSGLGLGTAATNPATAFQPSSLVLSNLSSSNGSALTNLTAANITGTVALASNVTGTVALASNVTGTIAISNGGSGATTTAGARTNFGLGALSTNEIGFGNVKMGNFGVNFIEPVNQEIVFGLPTDTDPVYLNPIHWNDGGVRTALGLGLSVLTNTNTSNFRTAIGLGVTNDVTFGSVTASSIKDSTGTRALDLLNFSLTFGTNYVLEWSATEVQFSKPLTFFGTNTAATTRTNLGLGWTGTNAAISRTNLGLGTTNDVGFDELAVRYASFEDGGNGVVVSSNGISFFGASVATVRGVTRTNLGLGSTDSVTFGPAILSKLNISNSSIDIGATSSTTVDLTYVGVPLLSFGLSGISFGSTSFAAVTRTNLGLGWSALTNSNAGTGLVSVSTNGEVVSPTNFWQVAPIVTRFVEFDPPTNATTNIVAARNLHIHSLAISRTGVTSTIALPTNNVFNGDIALVAHQGPTSSVTQVRTQGSTNNLVTMNRTEEAVEFVYYNNVWQFNHNQSFVEPIYFSGTNAAAHAAESRTNLGIPLAALTNTNTTNFQSAVFQTNAAPVSGANFGDRVAWMEVNLITNGSNVSFRIPLYK